MAAIPGPREQERAEDFGVLLGWSHTRTSRGIQLKVQSTSTEAGNPRDIAARNLLMTRNQALILAKYLLDATGQTLPEKPRRGRLLRLLRRLTGG
ncbi:hypothetical protein H7F51_15320 [Novosphingobium flavum]|uniref:Uncharacterized protein n=1 Tax=Novosphingobium flavum TaxID=1778672 RepID=A0A7X1FTX1_9SPHN|nr:hypothetical protein [Novosphingobium flavum]MBC2666888.1 hypothetical protein [Novosphingobium flavum]